MDTREANTHTYTNKLLRRGIYRVDLSRNQIIRFSIEVVRSKTVTNLFMNRLGGEMEYRSLVAHFFHHGA